MPLLRKGLRRGRLPAEPRQEHRCLFSAPSPNSEGTLPPPTGPLRPPPRGPAPPRPAAPSLAAGSAHQQAPPPLRADVRFPPREWSARPVNHAREGRLARPALPGACAALGRGGRWRPAPLPLRLERRPGRPRFRAPRQGRGGAGRQSLPGGEGPNAEPASRSLGLPGRSLSPAASRSGGGRGGRSGPVGRGLGLAPSRFPCEPRAGAEGAGGCAGPCPGRAGRARPPAVGALPGGQSRPCESSGCPLLRAVLAAPGVPARPPLAVLLAVLGPTERQARFVGTSKFVFLLCRSRLLECDCAGLAD